MFAKVEAGDAALSTATCALPRALPGSTLGGDVDNLPRAADLSIPLPIMEILAVSASPRAVPGRAEDAGPKAADCVGSLYAPTSFREGKTDRIRYRIHPNGPLSCDTCTGLAAPRAVMPGSRQVWPVGVGRRLDIPTPIRRNLPALDPRGRDRQDSRRAEDQAPAADRAHRAADPNTTLARLGATAAGAPARSELPRAKPAAPSPERAG